MGFEWDAAKAEANRDKHGVDFLDAAGLFEGPHWTGPARHGAEPRWKTVALLRGRFVTVVWTRRGDDIRIISARHARDEEKNSYRQNVRG